MEELHDLAMALCKQERRAEAAAQALQVCACLCVCVFAHVKSTQIIHLCVHAQWMVCLSTPFRHTGMAKNKRSVHRAVSKHVSNRAHTQAGKVEEAALHTSLRRRLDSLCSASCTLKVCVLCVRSCVC